MDPMDLITTAFHWIFKYVIYKYIGATVNCVHNLHTLECCYSLILLMENLYTTEDIPVQSKLA